MSTSMDALLEGVNAEFGGMHQPRPGGGGQVRTAPPRAPAATLAMSDSDTYP